ncbi:dTMP kinase [Brevundimonas aurifodinae]|uniref:Thymidylate kinase n=2 Tax=Brevundimonas TaxID=41275 RepID=A0ABV1NML1_9CAUL|nr:MAG: dTMP kinase [Brevundimonas sp. 12-68-7]OYX34570.1 MAG: dTMP kinase [Brevundimonas subvibrioides]
MTRGKFITFEGGEGTGKSTQAARLVDRLAATGIDVLRTREPGGSPGAEAIRDLVVSGSADRWSVRTELLLMYAARSDHLERTIGPALDQGRWVVCDRFADSSRVYQGLAGGADLALIEHIDAAVVGARQPDLTLVFDLPFELGLQRALGRGAAETRFETKGSAFHGRLRDGFRAVVEAHSERCRLIDAGGEPDAVAARVWAAVESLL